MMHVQDYLLPVLSTSHHCDPYTMGLNFGMKTTEKPQKGEGKHPDRKNSYMVDLCAVCGPTFIHKIMTVIG